MKRSLFNIALTLVATWSLTSSAEPAPSIPPNAKGTQPVPAARAAVAAPLKLSGALRGAAALNPTTKLAVAKDLAGRLKLAPPTGVDQPLRLSARVPYLEGRADLTATCARRFDPVADLIAPSIYQVPTPGFSIPLPQVPKPLCEQNKTQLLNIRLHPSRAGQAVMFDIVVELEPSPIPGFRGTAEVEVYNPLQPSARQSWELTEGEAGHLTGIMMPPGLAWVSLELRVLKGSVLVRSVELSPLR